MRFLVAATLTSLAAGCAATPPLPDTAMALAPTNAQAGLTDTHFHPVVNYTHREPVDPQNWRDLNRRLSPAEQGAGS